MSQFWYIERGLLVHKSYCAEFADPLYNGFLFSNQPIQIIDLKVTKKLKPTKNSTWPYLNEILAYFINEIKAKGYDALSVNLFPHKLMGGMRFPRKKRSNWSLPYNWAPASR